MIFLDILRSVRQDAERPWCHLVFLDLVEGPNMGRRRNRRAHGAWWLDWPQVRWYRGLDLVVILRYEAWGGFAPVFWFPSAWAEGEDGPPILPGAERDYRMKRPSHHNPLGAIRAAPVEQLAQLYPLIAEQLTACFYDDDPPAPRQTATLLIFAQDGTFRACLRDRQEQKCLWVACAEWDELLMVLEDALADPNAVWREDRLSGSEQAKRVTNQKKSA